MVLFEPERDFFDAAVQPDTTKMESTIRPTQRGQETFHTWGAASAKSDIHLVSPRASLYLTRPTAVGLAGGVGLSNSNADTSI